MHEENALYQHLFLNHCSEKPAVVGQKKTLMVEKVRKASTNTSKHSVLTQNEIESNWCNIALASVEVALADHATIHKRIGVYIIILFNKSSFSDDCLNNEVTLEPS